MPVNVEQIESDIYVLQWIDRVTLQEVKESHETTLQMATEAGVSRYVHILTAEKMTAFPLDAIGLLNVIRAYPQAFAVLIVNPPSIGRRLAVILDRMTRQVTLETFDSLDEARQRATQLLIEKTTRSSG